MTRIALTSAVGRTKKNPDGDAGLLIRLIHVIPRQCGAKGGAIFGKRWVRTVRSLKRGIKGEFVYKSAIMEYLFDAGNGLAIQF